LQPGLLRATYRVLGLFGLPVECAYDAVTIGRKITDKTDATVSEPHRF